MAKKKAGRKRGKPKKAGAEIIEAEEAAEPAESSGFSGDAESCHTILPKRPKWIDKLEQELADEEATALRTTHIRDTKKTDINRGLLEDFWRLWLRFYKLNAVMNMQPQPNSFLKFTLYPDEWAFRDDIDFGAFNTIALIDTTQEQNRVGDSLIISYCENVGGTHLKMDFEFAEGEKYHKYAGWKMHVSRYSLCDVPLEGLKISVVLKVLGDVVKAWYLSHIKRNRKIIVDFVRKRYQQTEMFTR